MTSDCDLLVVGGGPAGLCAAINGASEGLKVCILDASLQLGGQARESSAIENYPLPSGYPNGVTGAELMSGFTEQARKFETEMYLPMKAVRLHPDGSRNIITTDDYDEFAARAVLLSLGVSYRRHPAKNLGSLMGRGVYYGLPSFTGTLARRKVGVIGGANSAGQAVLRLARDPSTKVTMFVRRELEESMSQYLIDRIRIAANVTVMEGVDVTEVCGTTKLEGVTLGDKSSVPLDCLFVFIGAVPKTAWLAPCDIELDARKFVVTDIDLKNDRSNRLAFETSVAGVFAAGDVRSGSTKRIAAGIGEGAGALQAIHRYLN